MGWRVGGCQMEGILDLTVASNCEKLICTSLASKVNPYCTNIPNRLPISSGEETTWHTTVNPCSILQYIAVNPSNLASCPLCQPSPSGPPTRQHPHTHYPLSDCASCALPCDDSSRTGYNTTQPLSAYCIQSLWSCYKLTLMTWMPRRN